MMRIKSSRRKGLPASKPIITGSLVFIVAFFAAFFASSVLAPIQSSDATNNVSSDISFEGYFVKVQSSDVNMRLITNPVGAMTVVESTVKTVTNSPNGYKLYLSMSSDYPSGTEKTTADKQKNGLYLEGDLSRTDNMVVNAVNGKGGATSTAAPAALTDNTWGYAVDKNSLGAPDIWLTEDHSTMDSATPTSDKFAAVPAATAVDLIQETTTSNLEYDTAEEDVEDSDYTDANLYYGIRGNAGLEGGNYSNTIAYTAIGKISPSSTITFNPAQYTFTAPYSEMTWTDTVTIQTPISTSAEDLGTAQVYLSGGPDTVSGLACSNPTLSIQNNLLNVTCTLPQAHAGTYDVVVYLEKYGQIYTGNYTYVDPYSQSYTITISNTNTTTNVQSIDVPYGGTGYVEVTPDAGYYLSDVVCPQGYACSGYSTGSFANGTQIIAVANNNTTADGTLALVGVNTNRTIANSTYFQEVTSCPSTLTEGTEYTLTDRGEPSKTYKAARLKDNKCWMTSDYNLSSAAGTLSSTNYNVPSGSTYAPRASSTSWGSSATGNYVYNRSGTNGGLYSWYAATAGTNPSSGTSAYDICPKGWRLPTQAEYQTIINNYGSTGAALVASNAKLQYSGSCFSGNCPTDVGSNGVYWSSTATSSAGAYELSFFSSSAFMYALEKYGGLSVRCIFGS